MTLQEAIQHATEKAQDPNTCEGCRKDHKQLAGWLKELQTSRELLKDCLGWFEALDPDIENTSGELGKLVKKLRAAGSSN